MKRPRQSFSARIKQLRHDRGITVRQFADALGKSPGYVSRIEARGEIPSPELTCRIANLLGAPPEELLELARLDVLQRTDKEIKVRHEEVLSLFRKSK